MSTDELRDAVEDLIGRLPVAGIRMPEDLAALARRLEVLPLTWDMGGCIALRPTGEIVAWLWDEEDGLRPETSRLEQHRAMFQGAAKFDELKRFLPRRPVDATACPGRGGSGIVSGVAAALAGQLVCQCGGAGWLPGKMVGV
jgi:hypothetical protein